ncbi:tyrosine--tRNA ligase [Prochlorococcus marinus]|uniref:Tyrosine--tRNA ligase n=1 Tax=Prochlorococcus marinus (strain MIT 9211) TaxID=93059 RepID=A9BBV2_PROM4|nr:tyrosine--tRNA ligase [Prochlorococcus marinus]ABX09314.1 Tyrosyl-tRNA synthetase [Prochlorococcus marinus str. MIT 9211]
MSEETVTLPSWLSRGIADLFPLASTNDSDQSLARRLIESEQNQSPLRIKLGIDPTGSEIHLGHSILFRKLRSFQDAGHIAVLIIGDFTARIGDPTGKSKTRNQLTSEEVEKNAITYLEQLGYGKSSETSLLDFETPGRIEIRRNSEWLSDFDMSKIIDLLSHATVGQMLAKEDFANRYNSGTPISLHELLYPLLQGYDSVAVKADVELGGTDQKFNVAMGRDIQRLFDQRPQFGLLLPILVGLDGVQKMSKTLANTVALKDDALSMYSKLEKIPDDLVNSYLTLLTNLEQTDMPSNLREKQKLMALNVTANFHGMPAAIAAQEDASKLVAGLQDSLSDVPEVSIKKVNLPVKAFYLLSAIGLCKSSSEARRQILGGAVRLDGKKILDPNLEFDNDSELVGKVVQLGKRTFRRLSI